LVDVDKAIICALCRYNVLTE